MGFIKSALCVAALTGSVGLALAQNPAPPAAGPTKAVERATAEQLVDQLAPTQPLTRSLSRNIAPESRQIDLVINFDFDSDRLQPRSRPLLENLAEALNNPRLQGLKFRVEGHTDAKGAARYNEELSTRRARTVAEYLQGRGVPAERLRAEGKGFSNLLNKDQPEAPENRRVRIVTTTE